MKKTRGWLLCFVVFVIEYAGCTERESSLLRPMSKHYGGVHTPRTLWSYQPQSQSQSQEDFHRYRSQGNSHGYASYSRESALGATETASEHTGHSSSSQDYWRPSYATSNYTGANYYGYSAGSKTVAEGHSYREPELGSRSVYQYQHMLPSASSYMTLKKSPAYYIKGNLQLQSFDPSGKSKYKKTNLYQSGSGQKKSTYPRVHNPYPKQIYPTRKTVYPLRGNYYQSAYQRYSIPSADIRRYKLRPPGDGYRKTSTTSPSPASVSQRHHTTERMDDTYSEGSPTAEDYAAYNDTHRGSNAGYYETYEEVEKTTSEPQESYYDENTSRGYYGDRIYMSTQVPPLTSPDRASLKNKYFIVRRTSDPDDIETIFE